MTQTWRRRRPQAEQPLPPGLTPDGSQELGLLLLLSGVTGRGRGGVRLRLTRGSLQREVRTMQITMVAAGLALIALGVLLAVMGFLFEAF